MKKLNLLLLILVTCLLTFVSCEKDSELLSLENDSTNSLDDPALQKRSCSMEAHMEKLLADPEYREAHQRKFTRMAQLTTVRSANCTNITILPVAVHYQGVTNPDVACLTQLAETQIQVLNEDYQGTNPDIANWNANAGSFPGISNAEACIEFCIASQNHPSGSGLNDGDLAITFNTTSGDFVSNWSGYINIFVRPNTGVLGYSPLGGSGNGDGVVVDASAFGKGLSCGNISPNAPYDLGRTLTHEMGHYLLLDHIWGGGCGSDDGVNDTPNSSSPYYGCPNVGASTCSSTDMHMNYMDYTNDACMYMFSDGQGGRMENYVLANLTNVINNGTTACSSNGPTPTCTDGIQNGDETGIDCGGSTCPPCQTAPTCTDGIQNGDETGVDCGGNTCPPCQTAPTCTDGIQNGDETGVDCGGSTCPPCNNDEPSCYDGLQNGDETGIDCGGLYCEPCDQSQCAGTTLILNIQLDDYGDETRWAIYTDYGLIQAHGGPYLDAAPGEFVQELVCLEEGECFIMVAYDDYGDGICCEYGEGYYFLSNVNGDVLLEASGEFGVYQEDYFCIDGNNLTSLIHSKTQKVEKDYNALAKKQPKSRKR